MARIDDIEKMAFTTQARHEQLDMRVDRVADTASAALAASMGAPAGAPAKQVNLAGLAGWAPEAFSAWVITGGEGHVGVCTPDGCISYAGKTVPGEKFDPEIKKQNGLKYCETPGPTDSEGNLYLLVAVDGNEVDGVYLDWAESEEDARTARESGSITVAGCFLLVERLNGGVLQQRHVGSVVLGTEGRCYWKDPDDDPGDEPEDPEEENES